MIEEDMSEQYQDLKKKYDMLKKVISTYSSPSSQFSISPSTTTTGFIF